MTASRCHLLHFAAAPVLVLDHAFLQPAFADRDPVRHADQFPVGEHHARTLVAVVEDDIEAPGDEFFVQCQRCRAHLLDLLQPTGQITTSNGAMVCGQMMPRSSWFCSIAAPTRCASHRCRSSP
jgi:hypothetical protein